jgi:hypothetical protein
MKLPRLPLIVFLLSIILDGYGQQAASTYFTKKSEQDVIRLLNDGGFKIKSTLKAVPDSLAWSTLVCNGYNILGDKKQFEATDLVSFNNIGLVNLISQNFDKFLKCTEIQYIFDAEMALSPCILFVCTEGISIFCYMPQSQFLPSSFRVFLPPTDGTKHLDLIASFTVSGIKYPANRTLLEKMSFKFGGSSSASAPARNSAISSNSSSSSSSGGSSALHMADLTVMVKKNDIKGVEQVLSDRPDFFVKEHIYDAGYYIDLPLMNAVINKKSEMVKVLLQYGADPNDMELLPSGDIAMFPGYDKTQNYRVYECIPIDADYEATLRMMVDKIDLEKAVQTATKNGNVRLLEGLKKSHPGFSSLNLSRYLDGAIYYEKIDVVKFLIANGADPNWKNNEGKSMMDMGLKSKSKEIKSYFKEIKSRK